MTREVMLQATFNGTATTPYGQRVAGFTAETTIYRNDFGLNWNTALETGGVLVGDQAKVAIEIEAVLQDPKPENQASRAGPRADQTGAATRSNTSSAARWGWQPGHSTLLA